ncbi:MAG: FHA domain-containing protein [Hyphomicrobiaceae bacterium]
MKHPTRNPSDGINRRDAADEATIIIGAEESGQETTLAPQTTPDPAPTAKSIPADPGHTRILRPVGLEPDVRSDPVVGWLVVLSGPGKGNFRPIYSGSNTIGRSPGQRIPIDFGDDAISGEKQAFLVYDGRKRQYQLVPNLERPNLVHLNDSALLANGELKPHDKITMGRTTLLFVPLCGADFDWGDLK